MFEEQHLKCADHTWISDMFLEKDSFIVQFQSCLIGDTIVL